MKKILIEVDGKDYELKFTINTLCDMSAKGIDVMNFGEVRMDMNVMREMCYFALKDDVGKKLTINKAGEIMNDYIQEGHTFNELSDKILEALGNAMGRKEEVEEEVEDEVEEGK